MTATAIGRHETLLCLGRQPSPHPLPPVRQAGHGNVRRLMIDPDADPATVLRQVIDTRGQRFAQVLVQKVMHPDSLGSALGLVLMPTIGKVTDQFFVLRVARDHRLTTLMKVFDSGVDVLKLGVPIRMRRPLTRLPRAVQPIVEGFEELPNGAVAHVMPLAAQFLGQSTGRLPVQRRGDSGSPRVVGSTSASQACSHG